MNLFKKLDKRIPYKLSEDNKIGRLTIANSSCHIINSTEASIYFILQI